ncbi:hypothetical protein J2T55_000944 [Methylohalomonas lacus]|uniref:Uncharacterized protein n=1 Tax=Methylohalomonas lacus TaxID=398773 RepID=A0AAE3L1B4_9GAMM|nr:hypothetical protein [Methylohalomonas lacus]MCS3902936.1 hypothetical protein [Methylohalomonas lacus]
MSTYHPRTRLQIFFDDGDAPELLFHLDSETLVELAAHFGVTAPRAAKLAVRCLHAVLVEAGHYDSPALAAHLQRTNGPDPEMAATIARDSLDTAYDRPAITLRFADGADGDSLFRLHSRILFDLARQLRVSQPMAVNAAIDALHRALVRDITYLSPGLQEHICTEAERVAAGPTRTIDSLYTRLGLEDRQPWEV